MRPIMRDVLTLILGPLMERNLRKSLEMGGGDFMILVDRPLALAILVLACVAILVPLLRSSAPALMRIRDGDSTV